MAAKSKPKAKPAAKRNPAFEKYETDLKRYYGGLLRAGNSRSTPDMRPVKPPGYTKAGSPPAKAPVKAVAPVPKIVAKKSVSTPVPAAPAPAAPVPAAQAVNTPAQLGRSVPTLQTSKGVARPDPNRNTNARFDMLIPGGRTTGAFWK